MGLLKCCFVASEEGDQSQHSLDVSPAKQVAAVKVERHSSNSCLNPASKLTEYSIDPVFLDGPEHGSSSQLDQGPIAGFDLAGVLGLLTAVDGGWLEKLNLCSELLHKHLDASLVSIHGIFDGGFSYVTLASYGLGAEDTEVGLPHSTTNGSGPINSVCMLLGPMGRRQLNQSADSGEDLAADWQRLHDHHGLDHFVAVPMGGMPLPAGVMMVAKAGGPRPLCWTSGTLGALAAVLLSMLQPKQVQLACGLLAELSQAKDICDLVGMVRGGASELCAVTTFIMPHCRVALIREDGASAAIFEEATTRDYSYQRFSAASDTDSYLSQGTRRTSTVSLMGETPQRAGSAQQEFFLTITPTLGCDLKPANVDLKPGIMDLKPLGDSGLPPALSLPAGPKSFTGQPSPPHKRVLQGAAPSGMRGHSLSLAQTLLSDSLARDVGLWISDCTAYLQETKTYPRDMVVSRGGKPVHSLAITTSRHQSRPLMGVYCVYGSVLPQQMLRAITVELEQLLQLITPCIAKRLQHELCEEWRCLHDELLSPSCVDRPRRSSQVSEFSPPTSTIAVDDSKRLLSELSFMMESAHGARGGGKLGPLVSGLHDRLKAAQVSRLVHGSAGEHVEELASIEVLEEIGAGGYGTVYRGMYNSLEVAVKVVFDQSGGLGAVNLMATQNVHDAYELTVSYSVSHPHIVQVLTFFTDVCVSTEDNEGAPSGYPQLVPSKPKVYLTPAISSSLLDTSGALADSSERGKVATVICMEYCDKGSLTDAIRNGAFQNPAAGLYGTTQPNMKAIYSTLLEVALALRHLHSLHLVHCDLKPANVLLKSAPRDVRGFVTKLSDFGLVKLLEVLEDGSEGLAQAMANGTVTHMAPEVIAGEKLDTSLDIYAFGIIMWQMMMGTRVYPGISAPDICDRVVRDALRPRFLPSAPPEYRALAESCWSAMPSQRPSASELVNQLKQHLVRPGSVYRRLSNMTPMPQPDHSHPADPPKSMFEEEFPLHIL